MTVQPSSPGPLDKWMERLPPEVTEHVELKKLIIPGKYTLRQKLSTTLYFYRYIFVYINTVKTIKLKTSIKDKLVLRFSSACFEPHICRHSHVFQDDKYFVDW
jgi:hypothetical protein